jgi:uncharacterized protein YcfJ
MMSCKCQDREYEITRETRVTEKCKDSCDGPLLVGAGIGAVIGGAIGGPIGAFIGAAICGGIAEETCLASKR